MGLQLRAAGSKCAQYSQSAIFWHVPLALQNLIHQHGNPLETCQFWWDPPRNQADAEWHLLAKQFLKASLPPPPAAHLVGWWGDGRQGMESAKPQAPGSLAEGLPRTSWLLDLLASLWALQVLWREQRTACLLCEVSGNSYFSPAVETQISIFMFSFSFGIKFD